MAFRSRIRAYAQLMRIDKPIGVLLLLYPTLWALWMSAGGRPSSDVFIVFVAGVWVMRGAGCVINDYADRNIDGHVSRTEERPLATGAVSPYEALALFLVLMLVTVACIYVVPDIVLYIPFKL